MQIVTYINNQFDNECIVCLEEKYIDENENENENNDDNKSKNNDEIDIISNNLINVNQIRDKYKIQCHCTFKIHEACYIEWIRKNPSCPICHTNIESTNVNIRNCNHNENHIEESENNYIYEDYTYDYDYDEYNRQMANRNSDKTFMKNIGICMIMLFFIMFFLLLMK